MHFSHEGYFTYELPNGWCSEDSGENLLIYDPNGDGAMTISFFSIFDMNKSLDEHISIMAKKFVDKTRSLFTGRSFFAARKRAN